MVYISIIIPVFNAENTLEGSFNSILNQTLGFENLEVIFVDDCSTDSSVDIINGFSEKYSNVNYYCLKENSGFAGKPRNVGMEHATADYLMFLDPDDEFLEDACEFLYSNIINTHFDVVSGNYVKFYQGEEYPNEWEKLKLKDGILEISSINEEPNLFSVPASVWTKIFKKKLILDNNITFPVGIPAQDLVFVDNVLLKANGIKYINKPIVKYIQRDGDSGSVSLNRGKKLLFGYIKAYTKLYELFKEYNENFIKFSVNNLHYWTKQFCLSNLPYEDKLKLLKDAKSLYDEFKSQGLNPQKYAKKFFKYIYDEKYEEAINYSKKLSLSYMEKNDEVIEIVKNKKLFILFLGFDYEIGGLARAVCNRCKLLENNGYSITLLNIDEMKDFKYITNHYYEMGYLNESCKIINIYDYYSKKNTRDFNDCNYVSLDNDFDKIVDGYFVKKTINKDTSIHLKYYDSADADGCSKSNIVKEEIYVNNILVWEKIYNGIKKFTRNLYTCDGFKFLEIPQKNKNIKLYSRTGEISEFPSIKDFRDYFVTEICSKTNEKPFLINDCSSPNPSIKNISSDLVYKIGVVHSNPYKKPTHCFGSPIRKISSLSEIKYLDKVVVLTEEAKYDFEYEFNSNKFFVIPNFVFKDDFPYVKHENKSYKTISIFSRISSEKNISDLLYATSIVLRKHSDFILKIYGRALKPNEIKEKRKLEKLIKKLDISRSVKFMDHVHNVDEELSKSLATTLVSDIEGLPMVILESMIVGTPMVCYDINYGPRDMIVNGVNGIIVNQYDIKRLAEMFIILLDNPKKAEEMGHNARKYVLNNFSEEIILNKWNTLLTEVYIDNLCKN